MRKKWEKGSIAPVAADASHLPLQPRFAAAILVEVVEHMAFPEAAIQEIASILAPGGILCLTTPNGERFHTGMPVFSEIADRTQLVDRQYEPDADGHLFYFTKDELYRIVRSAGLEIVEHQFYGTPWLTGRLMGRYITQFLQLPMLRRLDRWTLRFTTLSRRLTEGQLLVARRR
jgi:SAM-dependent methyltransferase